MHFFLQLQNVQNEIFKISKMFKNIKFAIAACWINSKISNRTKTPHSYYSYFVTVVGHYYDVIIESSQSWPLTFQKEITVFASMKPFTSNILRNISRSKGNETMKFFLVIEYNKINIFLQNRKGSRNMVSITFCVWFFKMKHFSCCILVTDQISLPGCIYFLRYWSMCVL